VFRFLTVNDVTSPLNRTSSSPAIISPAQGLAMKMTRLKLVTIAVVIVAGVLFYPFESTIAPRWMIRALRPDGGYITGCAIEQRWEWRAAGAAGESIAITDASGVALFPPRTARASLMRRAIGTVNGIGFHTVPTTKSVQFFGCSDGPQPRSLGIYQFGDSITYEYRVPDRATNAPPVHLR
jgi:hypothetical protein